MDRLTDDEIERIVNNPKLVREFWQHEDGKRRIQLAIDRGEPMTVQRALALYLGNSNATD